MAIRSCTVQRGSTKTPFSYDTTGKPTSIKYNGTEYYYVYNAQGDVIKLIDANGTPVVEYVYDTWGKHISVTGTLSTSTQRGRLLLRAATCERVGLSTQKNRPPVFLSPCGVLLLRRM